APNTTTDDPGRTCAVLIAAPTPVVTPHPINDATSKGTSLSIFTAACSLTTISSANVPVPANANSCSSPAVNLWLALVTKPRLHSCGWPRRQSAHVPHGGIQLMITWSPGATLVTPSPTATTSPAPSWPSTAGIPTGIVPFIPDRSE